MSSHGSISLPVIRRLPRYYRFLESYKKAGVTTVSSSELAARLGTTASQVRQDFNCFGGFGQQGIGYSVDVLCDELERLLLGPQPLATILIGTGRLGRAIAHFLVDGNNGVDLVAAFDNNPGQIGTEIAGLTVQSTNILADWSRENRPEIAVLCVPSENARAYAELLPTMGVSGIWNFSHRDIQQQGSDTIVENVHLGDSLMSLGFQIREKLHP